MSSKAWIIFIALCVVLFGGLVIYSGRDRVDVSGVDANVIQKATDGSGSVGDHVFGTASAKVVLVEYGDFQCPGCKSAESTISEVKQKYSDEMAFVYRNFPLTNIHPNARAAAAAAEAAGQLGKFWEMHDILYDNQDSWKDASSSERGGVFAGYAEQIGLDKATFEAELEESSANINKKINFDIALGRKQNVSGTPSLYLNGKKLSEEQFGSVEALEKAVQDELKKQGVELPTVNE